MATGGFKSRTQRRQNLELSLLRRPSETPSISTYSPTTASASEAQDPSPTSPQSTTSTSASSIIENFDKLHALQLQLRNNSAQIEANEARMQQIKVADEELGEAISKRLKHVMEVNHTLSMVREMIAKVERVGMGEMEAMRR